MVAMSPVSGLSECRKPVKRISQARFLKPFRRFLGIVPQNRFVRTGNKKPGLVKANAGL
jgi:hypothetical protein